MMTFAYAESVKPINLKDCYNQGEMKSGDTFAEVKKQIYHPATIPRVVLVAVDPKGNFLCVNLNNPEDMFHPLDDVCKQTMWQRCDLHITVTPK